ncbi:choice-of-anchor Q domain-containing protein [Promineifilum sp.]|uniref:choice-of-anchor Q domain-containing protein n=1 Tax=Promineifilum sp. TaxID=2664178 RepID=UPI0035AF57F6
MNVQPIETEQGDRAAARGWLASLLLRRGGEFFPRFAAYYRRMAALPRPWRRQLRRKLAVTVSGAALLLALAGPVAPTTWAEPEAPAAVIQVVNGEVADVDNGKCSLIEAIINARTTRAGQLRPDCAAGNLSGPDTVSLPANGQFVLTAVHNEQFGLTGLPVITSAVTINGNGATIRRDVSGPDFRILAVDAIGDLTLRNATISNGYLPEERQSDPGGAGILNNGRLAVIDSTLQGNWAYLGGGGIANTGTLTVTNSRIIDNTGYNGGGAIANGGMATITGSLIAYNGAFYYNGGIENFGDMVITNSTVSGNGTWENGAGGIGNYGTLTLNNVTVTENSNRYSDWPGGIRNEGTLRLNRSIISGNVTTYSDPAIQWEIWNFGTIIANNHNVIGYGGSDGSDDFTPGATDVIPAGPLSSVIGPLANNGGPTWTHALPAGSPAIDLAPSAQCTAAPVNGVDQRGAPRNANGADGVTARECDAGSFERQQGGGGGAAFLVSPATAGSVGGVAFAPADILKFDPATGWSLYFDGSDVGVTKNVTAFEVLGNGRILLSFAANQSIPGVGVFAPQDIARFAPTSTGPNTAGSFQWEFDGSAHGLTTAGEKIDALGDLNDGRLALSTVGAAAVPGPGGTLRAQDEDALGLDRATSAWSAFFNGTAVPGLAVEDVNALWRDPATGDLYISIVGGFNLGDVAGNGRDIVKLTPDGSGGYTPSLWWDGSAAGFPVNIDGLELLP